MNISTEMTAENSFVHIGTSDESSEEMDMSVNMPAENPISYICMRVAFSKKDSQ